MTLFDDVLKGGTFVNGLAIGAVALIGWPLAWTLAKFAIRGGISALSGITALAKEAAAEAGGNPAKVVAAVGSDAAKGAVEEAGADIVEEAV